MKEILALALMLLVLGVLLVVATTRKRWARGFGSGQTIAIDNRTLFSEQLKLTGRHSDESLPARNRQSSDQWIYTTTSNGQGAKPPWCPAGHPTTGHH